MKTYKSLKKSAKLFLRLTLVISIAAILIGIGILIMTGGQFKHDDKPKDVGNGDKSKTPFVGKNKSIFLKKEYN